MAQYTRLVNPVDLHQSSSLIPDSGTTNAFNKLPPPDQPPSSSPSSSTHKQIEPEVTGVIDLQRVLVAPNCKPANDREAMVAEICRLANQGRDVPVSAAGAGGRVIAQGKIGFIVNNGVVYVVGPGRWIAYSPFSSWEDAEFDLNAEVVRHKTFTFARVPRGAFGLASIQGNPVVLAEGWHVYNNNQFSFQQCVGQNQPYLRHGTLHVLRVPTGYVAKVREGTTFTLIPEGILAVQSSTFVFDGMESLNQEVIIHGTITRYRVQRGEVALLWLENQPVVNDVPGIYTVVSSNVKWVRVASATESVIQLGSKKRIIVDEGNVGVLYNSGRLEVLEPGAHFFDSPNIKFDAMLSTRQRDVCLAASKKDFIRCETQDLVEVGVLADVFYKVIEPRKAILVVGGEAELSKLVKDNAVGTLQSIIRSSNLRNVAQSNQHATTSKGKEELSAPNQQAKFLDQMHDQFISRLHDVFVDLYGVEITNIRIEDFRILNAELAKNIAEQAILTAKTQTNLTNLDGQNQIEMQTQERQSRVAKMQADTEAYKVEIANKAKNSAIIKDAETEAEAMRIRSQAQAAASELENKVKMNYIEQLKNVLGAQGAIQFLAMQEWSRITTANMTGVDKVVYMPFDSNTNPVAFGASPFPFLQDQFKNAGEPKK